MHAFKTIHILGVLDLVTPVVALAKPFTIGS